MLIENLSLKVKKYREIKEDRAKRCLKIKKGVWYLNRVETKDENKCNY